MAFSEQRLSAGWSFKDRDDETPDAWMPVPVVPSTVQQDLIANKKLGFEKIFLTYQTILTFATQAQGSIRRL